MAGKRIILPSGKYGIGSGGKAAITDASGECPGCGCGGEPNTCAACGDCCYSDQSRAVLTWGAITIDEGCNGAGSTIQNGGSVTLDEVTTAGIGGIYQWDGSDGDETYSVTCLGNGTFALTVADTDNNGESGLVGEIGATMTAGCCGGTATLDTYYDCTGGSFNASIEWTLAFENNKCCKCLVGEEPACVVSTHDYGDDCDESDENTCNQFTGDEAFCDDAPA